MVQVNSYQSFTYSQAINETGTISITYQFFSEFTFLLVIGLKIFQRVNKSKLFFFFEKLTLTRVKEVLGNIYVSELVKL